ncbi:hypothetical protein [Pseudomonas costantinii]|uniref:Uncharacterized protein n=1 Tax=Pseudomonas costantinii TaxID=168469 RepID=A0A1S2V5J2_9PSED|nr:hypothetical protein [Pseudomonas costantinii]NVZ23483.1 hypothetical protein [Pseudomonas costantinii]OIN53983.1 hypothetical protein BFL40_07275 [Pseudomonas costantinii]SED17697.1 hypothetical protein SAMN04515675_0143 [Pseudomonas costantinii]
MSAIHEQAMNYVYQQVLQRLIGHFNRAERTALQLLIQRIVVAAGGMEQMGDFRILLAHGGGEVSSYTLALLRAAQLTIAGRAPKTFQLRVATLRHAGMTQGTLDTLHRGYSRLFFHDDPRVELLMVENEEVLPFNHQRPASTFGRETRQRNMLMVGHLTSGDICATLCNDTYLALGDFYQRVSTWNGGVHALVSGDSARKQSQLLAWLKKTVQAAGVVIPADSSSSLNGLFARMDGWSDDFYRDLYGEHYVPKADASQGGHRHLAYIGIADLVAGIGRGCTPLLADFMAYTPDPLGFHFSHPAYAHPMLMAHLRGLQAECLREMAYEEGVEVFIQQAAKYLRRLQVPEEWVLQAISHEGRTQSASFAQQFFGLDESQLVCLLFSPFIHHGERLEGYLRQCHPGMLVALPELHKVLQGKPAAEMLQQWVTDTSGLPLPLLQHLYRKRPVTLGLGSAVCSRSHERPMANDDMVFQLSGR